MLTRYRSLTICASFASRHQAKFLRHLATLISYRLLIAQVRAGLAGDPIAEATQRARVYNDNYSSWSWIIIVVVHSWGGPLACRFQGPPAVELIAVLTTTVHAGYMPWIGRNARPHPGPLPLGRGRVFDRERAGRQPGMVVRREERSPAFSRTPGNGCSQIETIAEFDSDESAGCFPVWSSAFRRHGGRTGGRRVAKSRTA